jgi:amidase
MRGLLAAHRDEIKPEAIAQIESGERITGEEVARAMAAHAVILDRMRRLHERYDFVVGAVNQVPPFDASLRWVQEIEGVRMEDYLAWMRSAYWYSVTFQPAASVPAGFTDDGLPVGVQILGRRHDDVGVLELAHAFEQATGFGRRRPPLLAD